ncbi:MAG: dihydropteroate synthase [Bifidobacteriaceae bacterium]|nr:dihydropteroate synthase [Bifidobacteriaceae bacterium]
MGICNVTPDSFSDGGRYVEPRAGVAHGMAMIEAGADIVDVGGESTRPGAGRIEAGEELTRVLPVVEGLARRGAVVSIDTMRADVARRAVEVGAVIVNDVSGGLADPAMYGEVARADAIYILMHWRGHSTVMDRLDHYTDVVGEVRSELAERVAAARAAGIASDRIVLDPGLGFAKTSARNWPLLAQVDALETLGYPVLVGASRKRFLADAIGDRTDALDAATAAVSALAAARGAWAVRVHDVALSATAVAVAARWRSEGGNLA